MVMLRMLLRRVPGYLSPHQRLPTAPQSTYDEVDTQHSNQGAPITGASIRRWLSYDRQLKTKSPPDIDCYRTFNNSKNSLA